ncbi:hypothetical protein DV515_00006752 [Chloebia gouldiae]|uniref:Uncharacterized protein n=1 Tax=Chloebia gouldiae TaxID=44316 RepID=A0A3L8SKA0_CHLGU|nr:hypothetical protein DV515_00006752 [Chloebia gouldiae]
MGGRQQWKDVEQQEERSGGFEQGGNRGKAEMEHVAGEMTRIPPNAESKTETRRRLRLGLGARDRRLRGTCCRGKQPLGRCVYKSTRRGTLDMQHAPLASPAEMCHETHQLKEEFLNERRKAHLQRSHRRILKCSV